MNLGAPADWMKSAAWMANAGHFLAGLSVLLVAHTFSHAAGPLSIVSALFVTYALGKEYWFDLRYESGEDVASSTVDFVGYIAGHVVAWALVLSAHGVVS